MTRRYFRIQPAGLGLDHRSETSLEEVETDVDEDGYEYQIPTGRQVLADGLHVFANASEVESGGYESDASRYGDEVVVIEAARDWPNGDAEGVCIDGSKATIVARVPVKKFRAKDWK
jgi:hypothetical protein